MTAHELKLDIKYFDDVKNGKKNFEIRKNDRNYKVGDILELRAFDVESGEYQIFEKSMSWDYESDWEFAFKEMADTVKVKVIDIYKHNQINNRLKILNYGVVEQGSFISNVLNILKNHFNTDKVPDDYIVMIIEVVE